MKVLICSDLSPKLESFFKAASQLLGTRLPPAQIDVLHVLDTRLLTVAGTERQTYEMLKDQSRIIYEAAKNCLGPGIRYIEEYGIPEPVIDSFLQTGSYDLIVTGTRGRSMLKGALLGSVAEHLLHHAHKPLLIVPD